WVVGFGPAFAINSTVSTSILSVFICPSDGLSPIKHRGTWGNPASLSCWQWTGEINNYMASLGTSTAYFNGVDTTGVFTQGGRAYGVQNVTDGTSNTIAFGESLIGDNTIELVKWRDGPTLSTPSGTCKGNWCGVYDVSSNYAGVIADLNACMAGFAKQTPSTAGAY